ncbi:MAG: VWA domain-containing protein [Candidatus Binatia bacterium]
MYAARFTSWDGSQRFRPSAEQIFERLAECLSYTDDLQHAWESLQRQGLEVDGERVMGLEAVLQQLRGVMRARREDVNVEHALDALGQRLAAIVALENRALEGRDDAAATAKRAQLQHLPPRLSAAVERLLTYTFEDARAASDFAELLAILEEVRAFEELRRRFGSRLHGPRALAFAEALESLREMARLEQLEADLAGGRLDTLSVDDLQRALGEPVAGEVRQLQQLAVVVEQAGYTVARGGRMHLSPKGARKIGQLALRDIYDGLLRARAGNHRAEHRGQVDVRPEDTKRYEFGDPFHIDVPRTLRHALARGARMPLAVARDDFEVYETTHTTSTSTVLLLDMSWSMSWEGRFAAAKKVALAMQSLIRARYPRDYFAVVGFYTRASELALRDLPEARWNMGDPFTNLQAGLRLANELLAEHPSPNQHMIVITDGQPTAYYARGRLHCEWPLSFGGISARAANETLKEVERVTRRGVVINTFMLDDNPSLRAFVERITRINRGRALFTRPDRLGEYLLVDYLARKRKRV